MTDGLSHEDLMRYLDGEVTPEEGARIDAILEESTELRRELMLFEKMKTDLETMSFQTNRNRSIWTSVHGRLTRPTGWVLLIAGVAVWAAYGSYLFAVSSANLIEKMATAGVALGMLMLLSSVVYERYRDWLTDPYRDVQR